MNKEIYKLKYPSSYYFEHADKLTEEDLPDCMHIIETIIFGLKVTEMQDYINTVRPWYRGKINFQEAYRIINE